MASVSGYARVGYHEKNHFVVTIHAEHSAVSSQEALVSVEAGDAKDSGWIHFPLPATPLDSMSVAIISIVPQRNFQPFSRTSTTSNARGP